MRPSEARSVYLNGHAPEKKAEIIALADELGPGKDDVDWLVAVAAADAAKRIEDVAKRLESAAPLTAQTLEAALASIARLEKKTARTAEPPLLPVRVVLSASAVLIAIVSVVACFVPWPWPAIVAAFALGAIGGLGQPWIGPVLNDWRWKLGLG